MTEVAAADAVTNRAHNPGTPTSLLETRYDHTGDAGGYTGGLVTVGPYISPPGGPPDFGFAGDPSDNKLKVVWRDYSHNRLGDGPVTYTDTNEAATWTNVGGHAVVRFDFLPAAYPHGVADVLFRVYDVDWRNNSPNNEQDILFDYRAIDVNGNPVVLTATYLPWTTAVPGGGPNNSYIIDPVGADQPPYDLGFANEILGREEGDWPNDPSIVAATIDPDRDLATNGIASSDAQGWGNVVFTTPSGVAIRTIEYKWGGNPRNPLIGVSGNGWGHEIGAVLFEAVPEPRAGAVALVAAALALAGGRRRRTA